MALLKCKMCGGSLEVATGETIIECEYCGTQQTLPKTTDENIQALFNRANLLRQKNEFDKAEALYEKILEADDTEAEAYWGVILCKFGIEYVEDPKTYKRIPTCHRTSYDSIVADEYYKKAIGNADITQRTIYEAEAKKIDEIQKGILAISAQEEPYDVFICYKETDENERRTQDSVIANDIYYQLTQEGFKVFYAAITLEDKLGSAYEPIIFAALNSSKVMLSIGTKPEYFSAVWVKNEWSRFLKMMKTDRSKMLIPCYKGMDAYELPEEFAHLQAQDMGKIGFINDVVRGIKKVIVKDEPKATSAQENVVISDTYNISPLIRRAKMFIEDGAWDSAEEYCEKVLDMDPENGEAYLYELMAKLKVGSIEELLNLTERYDRDLLYEKVMRFADESITSKIAEHMSSLCYNSAVKAMNFASTSEDYERIARRFEEMGDYKDAPQKKEECLEKADESSRNTIYNLAMSEVRKSTISSVSEAIGLFKTITGWKDTNEQIVKCEDILSQLKEKAEKDAEEKRERNQKRKKAMKICFPVLAGVIVLSILISSISYNVKKATLQNSFDDGTFSSEFIKEKYGTLHAKKFAYDVLEKEFEECRKNNDAKKALYYIYELSETGFVFEWCSTSPFDRPSIYFSPDYAKWLLDYASENGTPIETQIKQSIYVSERTDCYSYLVDGYSITFEKYNNHKDNVGSFSDIGNDRYFDRRYQVSDVYILTPKGWKKVRVLTSEDLGYRNFSID